MRFRVKNTLKRTGLLLLAVCMGVTSMGVMALADYSENQGIIIEDDILSDSLAETDDEIDFVKGNEIGLLDELDYTFNLDTGIASTSNMVRVNIVVTTSGELEETIATAEDGDTIEIANDINLHNTILIQKSINLVATESAGEVNIYSYQNKRHFEISGEEIYLTTENVIIDGEGFGGGIVNNANHLILDATICNSKTDGYGGALETFGAVTFNGGKLYNNTANRGGAICIRQTNWAHDNVQRPLVVNGGEIYNNTANDGGAIQGYYPTINGGELYNNTANIGGAIQAYHPIVNGGKIYNNTANVGGAIYAYHLTINEGEIFNNITDRMGTIYIYGSSNTVIIDGGAIHGNQAQWGGGIYLPKRSDDLIITGGSICENQAQYGGGIFIEDEDLSKLHISNAIVSNNSALQAYEVMDQEDITLHNRQISSSVTWTDGFDYIYNNLDVAYTKGNPVNLYSIQITQSFMDSEQDIFHQYNIIENKSFHYEFNIPSECDAIIESNAHLDVNRDAGTIDIESITGDINIQITYILKTEEDCHTITLITHYTDGILPDQSNSYQVRSGESFEQTYETLEGYEFAGISMRSYPLVDGDTKTVSIDSVDEDYTIVIKLARKSLNVKVTTHYVNGILPDETIVYLVLYGDNFAESYEALEGYTFVGMSVRSFPYVDGDLQMIYIDEVKEDYEIIIKLDRAQYNVIITVQYPEGTINNQTSTYSVLYGDTFLETFEVELGYRIAAVQTEKGVDVDFQNRIVEIGTVTKDISVIIICR